MKKTLIPLLERAFCRYVSLDPEALKKLSALAGKVLKLTFADWHMSLYLLPNADGIQIKSEHEKADAEITASSFELLRVGLSSKKAAGVAAKQIQIKGDPHLAQRFMQILSQIQINWEEPLSKFTGDIVAHQLGAAARRFTSWAAKRRQQLSQNVTEYLQEESRHLPSHEEVENFFVEVARLKNDVARLEAKISKKH